MSDSGYPQSEHSGSVTSRSCINNHYSIRKQQHPYMTRMNRENDAGNVFSESQTQFSNPDIWHESNLIVLNSEKESYLATKNSSLIKPSSSYKQSTDKNFPSDYGGWHPQRYISRQSHQSSERMGEEARKKVGMAEII